MVVYVFELAEYVISVFPANQAIYKVQTRPQGIILDYFQRGGLERVMGTRLRETHKSRFLKSK